jgi:hypothetical protein
MSAKVDRTEEDCEADAVTAQFPEPFSSSKFSMHMA